jgi:hypothetical protein
VPEQLGLDQVAGDGGHVDGDERAVAALAVVVQRAGDQLLAGAGLAGDHQRQIGLHQPGENPVDLLHRRRTADQRHAFVVSSGWAASFRGSESARPIVPIISVRSNGLGR